MAAATLRSIGVGAVRAAGLCLLAGLGCSSEPSAARPAGAAAVEAGGPCVFNDACPEGQRCECGDDACACRVGARGTGRSGVDACASGNDCESALCVASDAGSFCSGPCSAGCGDELPRCVDVATLGPICSPAVRAVTGATGAFSGRPFTFDKAYFGYDLGDAGPLATSVELQTGSDGSCPPPKTDPRGTIVLAGLPGTLAARSYAVKATLIGLDPALPLKSTASSVTLTLAALEPCAPPDARTCAFDATVTIAFPEGTVAGTVRAIHCDSMDVR